MAVIVMHSASGMNKQRMADLTMGLYKLSSQHVLEGAINTIGGVPVVLWCIFLYSHVYIALF